MATTHRPADEARPGEPSAAEGSALAVRAEAPEHAAQLAEHPEAESGRTDQEGDDSPEPHAETSAEVDSAMQAISKTVNASLFEQISEPEDDGLEADLAASHEDAPEKE